jgi:microsomal dipeptidase-like Zn-dependent dipeptidase
MMQAVAIGGGFVGINFMSVYPDDEAWREHGSRRQFHVPSVSWERILDHIDHAVTLVGVDAVGLGPDFYDCAMPAGMEDCTGFPRLTEGLLARGYREADGVKILGANMLTVMARVEAVGHARTRDADGLN